MLNRDLSVVIGRFQPLTSGHTALINEALDSHSDLLVIVGGANVSRSIKNPFTASERVDMLRNYFQGGYLSERKYANPIMVTIACVDDSDYDSEWWEIAVRECVSKVADGRRVTHYGHKRDASSYYMGDALVGIAEYKEIEALAKNISATKVRKALFECDDGTVKIYTPSCVSSFLREFVESREYTHLTAQYTRIQEYKEKWKSAPYPPTFVTVDATVFWCKTLGDHDGCQTETRVLLIRRRDNGLWAVPGGFLNPDEPLNKAVCRELFEETRIDLDAKNANVCSVFDDPDRDLRGRIITYNYAWVFNGRWLADPIASDDAIQAKWVPLEWVRQNPTQFYADHFKMLNVMAQKAGVLEPRVPCVLMQEINLN